MNAIKTENPGASAKAIQHHYDVGNEFYRLWLDSNNVYSGALWEENDSLDTAQLRKIDYHINQSKARGAKRVLDVGCGWGAVLKRLVEENNVEYALGLTLSVAQAEWIKSFNHPKIEVRVENWLDHFPEVPYDSIISIGAFEHFAKIELSDVEKVEAYRSFFQRCHEWLKPDGYLSLQTITYGKTRREVAKKSQATQFISKDIFPESDPPRLIDVVEAVEGLFEVVALHNDREGYERTCRAWLERLRAVRKEAINIAGDEVVADFEHYFKVFCVGFATGNLGLLRVTLRRINNSRS